MRSIWQPLLCFTAFGLSAFCADAAFGEANCQKAMDQLIVGSCETHNPESLRGSERCEWEPRKPDDQSVRSVTDRWNPEDPMDFFPSGDGVSLATVPARHLSGSLKAPEGTRKAVFAMSVDGSLSCLQLMVLFDLDTSVSEASFDEECPIWGVQDRRLRADKDGPILAVLVADETTSPDEGRIEEYRLRMRRGAVSAGSPNGTNAIGLEPIDVSNCSFAE